MNGQQLAKAVKQLYPTTKIIALSMSGEATTVEAMINDADISGYLLKQTNIVELANAIEKVYLGGVYFHEIILTELAQQHTLRKQTAEAKLTQRETQIIQLMETDLSNKEIAAHLNISVRTVETHRKNILAKTGCNNLLSLVKWAYEHGIISKK
jgi:DNA-binding NarL/FixJ family response regulator